MGYLNHKPGSIEEIVASQNLKFREDSGYQKMFKKELEKAGKGIGAMTPAEKKAFFNKIDDKYKSKSEELDSKDKPAVKKIITKLKGASQAHAGQAKDLEKAMNTEGMETMVPTKKEDDKKVAAKKVTDTGEKATKIETEPKIDYNK